MASDIRYRVLSHADTKKGVYKSEYVDKRQSATRRTSTYFKTKSIIGRGPTVAKTNPKGGKYASKYYDPVARHERYLEEKASLGIGRGSSLGSGGRRSRGSSGKAKRGNRKALAKQIQKLRDANSIETEAQREVAKRKIADLKARIKAQAARLSGQGQFQKEGVNTAEIRGHVQSLKKEIERTGTNLESWIKTNRTALENKVKALYKKKGIKYQTVDEREAKQKKEQKARDKKVQARADSIYKRRKTGK